MLWKIIYPYDFMGTLDRFNKTSLSAKKGFYSSLAMEDITDADYKHGKRV